MLTMLFVLATIAAIVAFFSWLIPDPEQEELWEDDSGDYWD